jgi:hypothetical protein
MISTSKQIKKKLNYNEGGKLNLEKGTKSR